MELVADGTISAHKSERTNHRILMQVLSHSHENSVIPTPLNVVDSALVIAPDFGLLP